jgi:hypothetical protein
VIDVIDDDDDDEAPAGACAVDIMGNDVMVMGWGNEIRDVMCDCGIPLFFPSSNAP